MSMNKDKASDQVFETLNPSLHQYFDLASHELDTPQPLHDEIATNEARYQQGTLIDQGGMKKILKIDDALTGRPVAMAILISPEEPQKVERFFREARLTATLEHPNIMPVYDIGLNDQDDPFFTMKLIEGQSLAQLIKENSALSLQSLLDIFIKICDAVAYAHSKGILHLDLKPSNIQIGNYGEVLVCDWGLAKVLEAADDTVETELDPCLYNDITLDGTIKGTPGFMAPEQVDHKLGEKDRRTDIYALGGILYTLLTKRAPVERDSVQDVLNETINGNITPPSSLELKANIPLSLEAVAMKALEKKPQDRYQKVQELRNDIHKWLGGFATSAENAGFLKSILLLFKRHKAVALLLLFISISMLGSLGVIAQKEQIATEALKLYEEEKILTEIIGKELSQRMAFLAKQAINSYDMEEALEFIDRAIQNDAQNTLFYFLKGRIHFYRQEFNEAIESFKKMPKSKKSYNVQKFLLPAQKYAQVKTDEQLLQSKEFVELLKLFRNTSDIFKLFRYEAKNYTDLEDHMRTCQFMLTHHNPQIKTFNYQFKQSESKVILNLSKNPTFTNTSALRNLPITHLNLANTAVWQTITFQGMPLIEINLTHTKIKDLKFLFKIPSLEIIYIDKKRLAKIKVPQSFKGQVIVP
jgi:eukaryotic-like serine/threonine-protein kinase